MQEHVLATLLKAGTSGFLNVERHLFNEQGPVWMLRDSKGGLMKPRSVFVSDCFRTSSFYSKGILPIWEGSCTCDYQN